MASNRRRRFNRTFMELKYKSFGFVPRFSGWFNRTFMELKSKRVKSEIPRSVKGLIVPLWN